MLNKDQIIFYRKNPHLWARDFLGVNLWSRQQEIAMAIANHDNVSVRSGHSVGKSFVCATIALWFLLMHEPPCKIMTTAPTFFQVESILWPTIRELHSKLKERVTGVGECLTTKLKISDEHFAVGRSTDDPHSLQGLHAENLLLIFDEACGISSEIFEAAESLASAAGNNKMLLVGNPTEPNTYFHSTHTGKIHGYHTLKIASTDSPNVKFNVTTNEYEDLDPPPWPGVVGSKWINKQIKTYGRNSNHCKARVFGEFPTQAEDQLIDGKHVAAAIMKGKILRGIMAKLDEDEIILSSQQISSLK